MEIWGLDRSHSERRFEELLQQYLLPRVELQHRVEALNLFRERGRLWAHELVLEDGTFVEMYSKPVLDQENRTWGHVWFVFDINNRKVAELRLRDALAESSRLIRLMEGREQRILALKSEVNHWAREAGQDAPYLIDHSGLAAGYDQAFRDADQAGGGKNQRTWLTRLEEGGKRITQRVIDC